MSIIQNKLFVKIGVIMKSYYIHFICHGNIDETHKGKYIGTTNVPLSDKGKNGA